MTILTDDVRHLSTVCFYHLRQEQPIFFTRILHKLVDPLSQPVLGFHLRPTHNWQPPFVVLRFAIQHIGDPGETRTPDARFRRPALLIR